MWDPAAAQMLNTARWYLRQGDGPSTRFQLQRLLRKHPTSAAAREAVDIMIERGWMEAPPEGDGPGEDGAG